jgi:hypothetical protein
MTDVPFVSVMNGSLLFYVRWAARGRTSDLAIGSGLAIVAFLVRQLGAALAVVPIGYLIVMRLGGSRRALPWHQRVWLLVPFVGLGLALGWIYAVHGETRVYHEKAEFLSSVWSISGWIYVREVLHLILHVGLVLWPFAWTIVGHLSLQSLACGGGIVAALCGICFWYESSLPAPLAGILTWNELGIERTLIAGALPDRPWLVWPERVVLGVSLSAAALLMAALFEVLRRWSHWIRSPVTLLVLNGLCILLFLQVLWLFYDRYYLPLLPASSALLMALLQPTKRVTALILTGALLWGAIAVTGTIDMFRFSTALTEARSWLVGQGVTPQDIDAGYGLNGWWIYAPALPSGRGAEPDVPFITSNRELPYKIANTPDPAYRVVRRITWPVLWAATDTLYVLKHNAVTE